MLNLIFALFDNDSRSSHQLNQRMNSLLVSGKVNEVIALGEKYWQKQFKLSGVSRSADTYLISNIENLALAYCRALRFEDAIALMNNASTILAPELDGINRLFFETVKASVYSYVGDSITCYRNTKSLLKELESYRKELKFWSNPDNKDYNEYSINTVNQLIASCRFFMAGSMLQLGYVKEAASYLSSAKPLLYRICGMRSIESTCLMMQNAWLDSSRGDFENAQNDIELALMLRARALPAHNSMVLSSRISLAAVHVYRGNIEQSEEQISIIEPNLRLLRKGGCMGLEEQFLHVRALLAFEKNDLRKSLSLIEELLMLRTNYMNKHAACNLDVYAIQIACLQKLDQSEGLQAAIDNFKITINLNTMILTPHYNRYFIKKHSVELPETRVSRTAI